MEIFKNKKAQMSVAPNDGTSMQMWIYGTTTIFGLIIAKYTIWDFAIKSLVFEFFKDYITFTSSMPADQKTLIIGEMTTMVGGVSGLFFILIFGSIVYMVLAPILKSERSEF